MTETQRSTEEGVETSTHHISGYVRDWLNENKIYFETISATLLAIMAIIISVGALAVSQAQLEVASQQTALLELQMEVERQGNLPHFFLNTVESFEDELNATTEYLLVYNQGDIAYAVTRRAYVFIELSNATKQVQLPVNGYYNVTEYSGSATDLVMRLFGVENYSTLVALRRELDAIAESRGIFLSFELKRYLRLDYQDLFGVTHTEYHFVPSIGPSVIMSTDAGQEIEQLYDDSFNDGTFLDFGRGIITAEMLLDRFEGA